MLKKIPSAGANAVLSAFVGLLVGFILLFMPGCQKDPMYTLLTASGLGVLIGTASRFSACLVYEYGLKHPLWTYCLTFTITLLGCLILALPLKNSPQFIYSLIIAEPLALLTAYINLRYAANLNDSLKRKQAEIKKAQHNQ